MPLTLQVTAVKDLTRMLDERHAKYTLCKPYLIFCTLHNYFVINTSSFRLRWDILFNLHSKKEYEYKRAMEANRDINPLPSSLGQI